VDRKSFNSASEALKTMEEAAAASQQEEASEDNKKKKKSKSRLPFVMLLGNKTDLAHLREVLQTEWRIAFVAPYYGEFSYL
jgi:hypothetical protein